jgi:single-stranded-DNA-specific exonuclease
MEREWIVADTPDAREAETLQRALGVPSAFARLLCRRGIADSATARRFLSPSRGDLGDPFRLRDADRAVERLDAAISSGEQILVHGDYDVDGTTATALNVRVLRELGAKVDYFIPHRIADGYGLSARAVDHARSLGASLILTADCGIGAFAPIAYAAGIGVETIVTDHHEVGDRIPEAAAVVNPKRPDCGYPFKDFAGVGVAFKLLQALVTRRGRGEESVLFRHLDLVALGTIADVVPLLGENRVLAREGLALLSAAQKPGIAALLRSAGLTAKEIDAGHVAFVLAPRINAAGRLGDSHTGVRLLLSDNEAEATSLAENLEQNNLDRRKLDEAMLEEAVVMLGGAVESDEAGPIVLWSPEWHSGVLGIVASRLVERYRRPTILIALDGQDGRGSGRSIGGFDLVDTLGACADLLEDWGGHKYAVGLTIRRDNLVEFRRRFAAAALAGGLARLDRRPTLEIEENIKLEECTRDLAACCEDLEPFGFENPQPVFASADVQLMEAPRRLGEQGQHLGIQAYQEGHTRACIGFGMGELAAAISRPGQRFAIAYTPTINRWRGRERLQLKLRDLRPE